MIGKGVLPKEAESPLERLGELATREGNGREIADAYRWLVMDYKICPLGGLQTVNKLMTPVPRICLQDDCALWNGKKCGLVKGQG